MSISINRTKAKAFSKYALNAFMIATTVGGLGVMVKGCAADADADYKSRVIEGESRDRLAKFQADSEGKFDGNDIAITSNNAVTLYDGTLRFTYNYQQRMVNISSGLDLSQNSSGAGTFQFGSLERKDMPERVRNAGCTLAARISHKYPELKLPGLTDDIRAQEAVASVRFAHDFAHRHC